MLGLRARMRWPVRTPLLGERLPLMLKAKIAHPGSHGATKWYYNAAGDVVYGEKPVGHVGLAHDVFHTMFGSHAITQGHEKLMAQLGDNTVQHKQDPHLLLKNSTNLTWQHFMQRLKLHASGTPHHGNTLRLMRKWLTSVKANAEAHGLWTGTLSAQWHDLDQQLATMEAEHATAKAGNAGTGMPKPTPTPKAGKAAGTPANNDPMQPGITEKIRNLTNKFLTKGQNVNHSQVRSEAKDTICKQMAARLVAKPALFERALDWVYSGDAKSLGLAPSGSSYSGSGFPKDRADLKTDPELQKKAAYAISDKIIRNWAATSADTNPHAGAFQLAIAREFDTGKESEDAIAAYMGADWQQAVAHFDRNEDFWRGWARTMYENTQEEFAKAGITHVSGHRGMGFPMGMADWASTTKGAQAPTALHAAGFKEVFQAHVPLFPGASFSTQLSVAKNFGSHGQDKHHLLVQTTVPVTQVLGCARTGVGCLNEYELVLMNGAGQMTVGLHRATNSTVPGMLSATTKYDLNDLASKLYNGNYMDPAAWPSNNINSTQYYDFKIKVADDEFITEVEAKTYLANLVLQNGKKLPPGLKVPLSAGDIDDLKQVVTAAHQAGTLKPGQAKQLEAEVAQGMHDEDSVKDKIAGFKWANDHSQKWTDDLYEAETKGAISTAQSNAMYQMAKDGQVTDTKTWDDTLAANKAEHALAMTAAQQQQFKDDANTWLDSGASPVSGLWKMPVHKLLADDIFATLAGVEGAAKLVAMGGAKTVYDIQTEFHKGLLHKAEIDAALTKVAHGQITDIKAFTKELGLAAPGMAAPAQMQAKTELVAATTDGQISPEHAQSLWASVTDGTVTDLGEFQNALKQAQQLHLSDKSGPILASLNQALQGGMISKDHHTQIVNYLSSSAASPSYAMSKLYTAQGMHAKEKGGFVGQLTQAFADGKLDAGDYQNLTSSLATGYMPLDVAKAQYLKLKKSWSAPRLGLRTRY